MTMMPSMCVRRDHIHGRIQLGVTHVRGEFDQQGQAPLDALLLDAPLGVQLREQRLQGGGALQEAQGRWCSES